MYIGLDALLEEAKLALASDDIGVAISRMEALLSTIHKMILRYAPTGVETSKTARGPLAPQLVRASAATLLRDEATKPGQLTILVVDDDQEWLWFVGKILRLEGFSVTEASSTAEALGALVDKEFDLVLSDLVLCSGGDRFDGREIALAAKMGSPRTKVIILTGFFQMSEAAHLMRAGVDDVLDKRRSYDDIVRSIRAVVAGG